MTESDPSGQGNRDTNTYHQYLTLSRQCGLPADMTAMYQYNDTLTTHESEILNLDVSLYRVYLWLPVFEAIISS